MTPITNCVPDTDEMQSQETGAQALWEDNLVRARRPPVSTHAVQREVAPIPIQQPVLPAVESKPNETTDSHPQKRATCPQGP